MSTSTDTAKMDSKRSSVATRLFSLGALCGAVAGIGFVGHTVYHVVNDGFVAPIILSPDSDMVLTAKLNLSQVLAEQVRITAAKETIEAELEAGDKAIEQLRALHAAATRALEYTSALTKQQANSGAQDQTALAEQRAMFTKIIEDEASFTERMKKDLDAGLVSKSDYARQVSSYNQLRLAAIENDRAKILSDSQLNQVRLTQQAMNGVGGKASIATPEMLMQQDQLVRVTCELLRLEAEHRGKTAEHRHIEEELAKIDELLTQLKARPLFRAIDTKTDVAFIPYSQIDGVAAGAKIYDCVWGVFSCKDVGQVTQVLPGEAIVQDPWGSPARGLYAIMDLTDPNAATSKTLRVRPSSSPLARFMAPTPQPVTQK